MKNFGEAIEALKKGKRVARNGWHQKEMLMYLVSESADKAVKESTKDTFPYSDIPFFACIAMKTVQNKVVTWVVSQSDVLAEDWIVLE